MSSTQRLVSPKLPTILADQKYVDLPGYDLFLQYEHGVLVFPAHLDVPKFEEALSRALQVCPHAAGRLRCRDGRWFIELANSAVPVNIEYKLNTSSDSFLDGDWVVQDDIFPLLSHQTVTTKVINGDTPLVRFKLTFFDNETCLGASWHHSLGDGTVMLRCLHTFSQFYQGLSQIFAVPSFQKYQFPTPSRSVVAEFWPRMPYLHPSRQLSLTTYLQRPKTLDNVKWRINSDDLEELRSALSQKRENGTSLSKQDCLIAYLVSTMNYNRRTPVRKVTNMISCRDVATSFLDQDAASSFLVDVTADVPTNMAGIAAALRSALIQCREPDYLYGWFTLKSDVMLEASNAGNIIPYFGGDNEMIVISYLRMDWFSVHFGYPDGTRFYTTGVDKHCLKLFRSNPEKGNDGVWQARQSADISIGVPAGLKQSLVETLSRGVRHMQSKERARL